ncbi:MAG: DALR anticodon-binding domain-containing protein, partial [Maritimibacter sp.]
RENPVFYVQYANARVHSVLRKAAEQGIEPGAPLLSDEAEISVAKKLAEWPRLVEIAARGHEPHRIAFYLYDLASELHGLWNKGNENPALRFVQEGDSEATSAKIALPKAVSIVISAGLGILGVTPAEEMR